jgi:Tol biopolymer transport system component
MRPTPWALVSVSALALLQVTVAQEAARPADLVPLPQRDHVSDLAAGPSVSLSADGRYAAFVSRAPLVEADTRASADIYVLDQATGEVTLETLTAAGQAANGGSGAPRLDGSGRHLVFSSAATNLVDAPLVPGTVHVFLRDRLERTTRLVSIDRDGRPTSDVNDANTDVVVSLDGSTVAFASGMTTLVAGQDRNGRGVDVYVVRLANGDMQRVSVTAEGHQPASGMSFAPSLSADGRLVAFTSTADLTCPRDEPCARGGRVGNDRADVYVHDTQTGRTVRVSRAVEGSEPNGRSFHPTISADGRFVAFASAASNLVAKDRNRGTDIFVADLEEGTIDLVSRTPRGRPGNGKSNHPVISGDGSLVAFQSEAANLVCASRCPPQERDINMVWDVFVRDRRRGTTVRASADGDAEWMAPSGSPALAAFASVVAFSSRHPIAVSDVASEVNAYVTRLPGMVLTRKERYQTSFRAPKGR